MGILQTHRKLIAAIVGVVAIILGPEYLGLASDAETLAQSIMALVMLIAVERIPNEPAQ